MSDKEKRQKALDELVRLGQELGDYDSPEEQLYHKENERFFRDMNEAIDSMSEKERKQMKEDIDEWDVTVGDGLE